MAVSPPPSMLEPPPPPPPSSYGKGENTPENHFPRFEPTAHPPGPRRIYFTTKQKISERLGLRCLGLLTPRRGLGNGGACIVEVFSVCRK